MPQIPLILNSVWYFSPFLHSTVTASVMRVLSFSWSCDICMMCVGCLQWQTKPKFFRVTSNARFKHKSPYVAGWWWFPDVKADCLDVLFIYLFSLWGYHGLLWLVPFTVLESPGIPVTCSPSILKVLASYEAKIEKNAKINRWGTCNRYTWRLQDWFKSQWKWSPKKGLNLWILGISESGCIW